MVSPQKVPQFVFLKYFQTHRKNIYRIFLLLSGCCWIEPGIRLKYQLFPITWKYFDIRGSYFAFRYYTHEDAADAVKYISTTKLDDRIIRADYDAGFKEGRQYGRGKSGGQVSVEIIQNILWNSAILTLSLSGPWRISFRLRSRTRRLRQDHPKANSSGRRSYDGSNVHSRNVCCADDASGSLEAQSRGRWYYLIQAPEAGGGCWLKQCFTISVTLSRSGHRKRTLSIQDQ